MALALTQAIFLALVSGIALLLKRIIPPGKLKDVLYRPLFTAPPKTSILAEASNPPRAQPLEYKALTRRSPMP